MAEITWDFPEPHIMQVQVDATHIDVMKHTNNVVYLQWLEDVAWSHSQQLGLCAADYERLGYGMVARRHELDYLMPTFLGDELLLATWITYNDRLSTRRAVQFVRVSDGQTVLRGRTHLICVDIKEGKVRRMPPEFQAAYQSSLQIKE